MPSRLPRLGAIACLVLLFGIVLGGRGKNPAPAGPSSASGSGKPPTAGARPGPAERGPLPIVPPERPLFSWVTTPRAAELDRRLPAPSPEIHYVRVDPALVLGKASPFWQLPGSGRVHIPLPDGRSLTVVIEGSEMLGPDRFTSTGRVEGHAGSRALFSWNHGFLHASVQGPTLGAYALRAATEDLAQFYAIAPDRVGPCGGERRPRREADYPLRSAAATGAIAAVPATSPAVNDPQQPEIHVLMLYTQSVLPTMSGASRAAAVQGAFDLAIARTNDAFAASLIPARVKLVGVAETFYDESRSTASKVQDDALTAVYLDDDGQMDEIHALRDRVGADIVCLALQRADIASSGLSFLLDAPDDPTNSIYAFSIVQYTSITGTNVVPHEFGHVFGCAHDRENALSGEGAFPFSYGYRFRGADGTQYHDIMSYPPGVELSYFSNPDITAPAPASVPLGIAAGRPGESNTALTIERTAFVTSGYRLQTQAPPGAGLLVNVATRAFVGMDNQVLIAGFVVSGGPSVRVLVRAAGPALAGFGVAGALADPVLRVFSSGALVAENDQWGAPVVAGLPAVDLAAEAARAGAFPFAAGSSDAALLLTLPAGAYSAVVEGARGTTGAGLVEAYEIGTAGARVINLATRGFAGRDGREMVAGFVVDGAAGETKRMLVRVLGPTLGRAPFLLDGVLNDPEMEIRNAEGEVVLRGDDWSSGAEGGISSENDFRPLVKSYGEARIFATGLAPGNRREPCILADFPAGRYTVVVRPFERVSTDPGRNQPAVPGVGVVEVYEIDR